MVDPNENEWTLIIVSTATGYRVEYHRGDVNNLWSELEGVAHGPTVRDALSALDTAPVAVAS